MVVLIHSYYPNLKECFSYILDMKMEQGNNKKKSNIFMGELFDIAIIDSLEVLNMWLL